MTAPHPPANTIVKFADDTTIVGLITNNRDSPYRKEIRHLTKLCTENNLDLNTSKTKELIVDFQKFKRNELSALYQRVEEVERIENFSFFGVHISTDLAWTTHISHQVGKAQQRLYFLSKLKQAHLPQHLLTNLVSDRKPHDLLLYGLVLQLHSTG